MKAKYIYLVLFIIGTILPYASFAPWIMENGLNIPLLVHQIAASPVAAFGWLDVIISAIALIVFINRDRRKRNVRYWWLPIIGTLVVGVSLGLPLYLFLREISQNE